MVQTFLLLDTITNEKTVVNMSISTTWHIYPTPGLAGSNNPYYVLTSLSI